MRSYAFALPSKIGFVLLDEFIAVASRFSQLHSEGQIYLPDTGFTEELRVMSAIAHKLCLNGGRYALRLRTYLHGRPDPR